MSQMSRSLLLVTQVLALWPSAYWIYFKTRYASEDRHGLIAFAVFALFLLVKSRRPARPEGSLTGPAAGVLGRTAGTNVDSFEVTAAPLGGTLNLTVDLTTTGHASALIVAYFGKATLPFGTDVVLVDLFHPAGNVLPFPAFPGPVVNLPLGLPNNPSLCGVVVYAQAAHVDAVLPIRLSNAQDVFLGS